MTIKVPGKLMMAGEYAVLEPNYEMIVMAVNRYVYATIELTNSNSVTLENFHLTNIPWLFSNRKLRIATEDPRKRFVEYAMEVALTYLYENDRIIQPFSLTIKSELDDVQSGRKYGLGSSAAVATAAISVILKKFAPELATKETIFKLAAITHINIQGNGSGADIAASTYGGVIAYKSFQADWLKETFTSSKTLSELVMRDWTFLQIEPLSFPMNLFKLCVGWTGNPASTGNLVDKILRLKKSNIVAYESFLKESERAVKQIKQAIKTKDVRRFYESIEKNRQALATLGDLSTASIETQRLKDLAIIAQDVGGAGKLSGAGGGDCGIAFVQTEKQAKTLRENWQKLNIQPLPLQIELVGISTIFEKE